MSLACLLIEGSRELSPAERASCNRVSRHPVRAATSMRRAASNVYVVYMRRMLVARPLAALRGSASVVVMTTRAPAVTLTMM